MPIRVHKNIKHSTFAEVLGFNVSEVCIGGVRICSEPVFSKYTKNKALDCLTVGVSGGA